MSVVEDPDPAGPPNALRAARLAWRAAAPGATHLLVVQDDMRLTADFADRCRLAAAALPGEILCFFSEWGSRTSHAVRLATIEGASWVPVLDPYIPTTAVLLPVAVAEGLADFAESATGPDDVQVLRYAAEAGLTPLVSVPNLAEHEICESLIGNDLLMGPRHATLFADDVPGPTAAVDATVSRLRVVPHLGMFEGIATCHVRPGPDAPWHVVKAHDYLAPSGLAVADLLRLYAATVDEVDGARAMRSVVADSMLVQLWLTAFLYGVVAAEWITDVDRLPDVLAAPLVRAGLRTLAPGALRRFVPAQLTPLLGELTAPLVTDAMRLGVLHGLLHGEALWKQSFQ
ncbi:hypothetical protein F4553_006004 [Allocatelliglobosispora scoriae]|uniref:Uncharacterized protein n=1 Tax=Allocatelliglobosispora scoriae TaxID=643052 RepID=A0A841C0T2_9ACTN|nr:hypothetical protein [Allocatelliglobosispora scoriae]MBB5872570.1 hypothetical protein [Allocatelliglobosispora scoriae]